MAKIKHIAIAARDPEETANFYREVFGLHQVGKIDSDTAEGVYLSDGDVNLAIVRFKSDAVAGGEFGAGYNGVHHIGFHVENPADTDRRLRTANSPPRDDVNAALTLDNGRCHERNVEIRYGGPDGVMIGVSSAGWVGTGAT